MKADINPFDLPGGRLLEEIDQGQTPMSNGNYW